MTLRDILRKKSSIEHDGAKASEGQQQTPTPHQDFTFIRTTTWQEEKIGPPVFPGDHSRDAHPNERSGLSPPRHDGLEVHKTRRSFFSGHHRKHNSTASRESAVIDDGPRAVSDSTSAGGSPHKPRERSLSARLSRMTISRSVSRDSVSANLPANLDPSPSPLRAPRSPGASQPNSRSLHSPGGLSNQADQAALESAWEARATQLALSSPPPSKLSTAARRAAQELAMRVPGSASASAVGDPGGGGGGGGAAAATATRRTPEQQAEDEALLQRAIVLHEAGDLPASTALFGRLADPGGCNSALAQVLYGLALRHGWGLEADPVVALRYLTLAASNAGALAAHSLQQQQQQQKQQEKPMPDTLPRGDSNAAVIARATGGPAKGELVLAIFELGNCYRHGWGTDKDPRAAREYYETAANLGDVDAMEEASWCFLQGFGGAKDKGRAARYLRLAEGRGRKSVGNSWIWKEKYDAPS